MKISHFIRTIACAVVAMGTVACYDDAPLWDELEGVKGEMSELEARIASLEKSVAANVSAIQSMVSVGSISSWTFNAETGKGVITLVDGSKITISQEIKGFSIITVEKGDDGVYYWAICRDGVNLPLMIDNKKVPVTVTPSLKISDENEWMISVDGGKTWVNTGISYYMEEESEEVEAAVFEKAELDGDNLILTLVGGTQIKVAVVGEAVFKAAADSMWFSRRNMQKSIALEMKNVKAFTITEKPEGWKAVIEEPYLFVTSPANFSDSPAEGTIKIFALFDNGANPEIVSVNVAHEPMLSLARANGVVSVKLSKHTGEDFTGYVLVGMPKREYAPDSVVAKLNAEHESLVVRTGTEVYNLADIIDGYVITEEYVVAAVPYLPSAQVAQGNMKYEVTDVVSIETIAEEGGWEISNLMYDSADLVVVMDVPEYYGGFMTKERWDAMAKEDMLELLNVGNLTSVDFVKYEGPANGFPDGTVSEDINPATEYVVWYVPVLEDATYTLEMFEEFTFTTPDVVADGSVSSPTYEITNVTASGFTAEVTPAGSPYKTYAHIAKAAAIPETEVEIVRYLIDVNHYTKGSAVNTVTTGSFDASDEVYLLAVSVSADGGYSTVIKEKVALKQLSFTDAIGVEVTDVEYDDTGAATFSLSFKGSPVTMTYMAASYTYYTDEILEQLMAKGQLGDAKKVEISKIGGKVTVSDLSLGVEHKFYAVVTDAEDNHSHLYTYTFTPSIELDYVMSTDSGYKYGMPTLSGALAGKSYPKTYTLNVDMPAECAKYWLFCGDAEYFTGDKYQDTDKMITMGLESLGETVHTGSTTLEYERIYAHTRIYMVWLDSKGNYHAIYEYNPTK